MLRPQKSSSIQIVPYTNNEPRNNTNTISIARCDIIFLGSKRLSKNELHHNIKTNIPIHVTQDKQKYITITVDNSLSSKSVITDLLNNPDLIDQLIINLKIVNAEDTKKIFTEALHALSLYIHTFEKQYNKFHLHQELIDIINAMKHNKIEIILNVALGDKLRNLIDQIDQANKQISSLVELCNKKVADHATDESKKIMYSALKHVCAAEKKRLADSMINLNLINNQIHAFLKRYHGSSKHIETLLDGVITQDEIADTFTALSKSEHGHGNENPHYWLFKEILLTLNKTNLLSQDTVKALVKHITKPGYTEKMALALLQQLTHLKPLLSADLLNIIINGNTMNHSCDSRLKGSGLENVNRSDAQLRWAYCSEFAINWATKHFAANQPLTVIMSELAGFRQRVAINENIEHKEKFGSMRDEESGDIFADAKGRYTATSPDIFPDLVVMLKSNLHGISAASQLNLQFFNSNRDQQIEITSGQAVSVYSFNWETKSSAFVPGEPEQQIEITEHFHGLRLPKRIIKYNPNFEPKIETEFSVMTSIEHRAIIDALNQHCVLPLKNIALSKEEKVSLIGELAYYLSVLYPYKRGSAGITLWMLNGLCKEHFGVTVGQISMGKNANVPFDVYAHLSTDVNRYKEEFAQALIPKITLTDDKKLGLN